MKELSLLRQDFSCLMAGEGPDWYDMREYAGFLGILDTFVQFTGVKTGSELPMMLNSSDFSVLSSRYETFGTVVIESLACGVPVVATATGIAKEVIGAGNGLLVPPGDEKAMTEALFRMLDTCRDYDKETVRQSISDKFSKETVGKQIVALYHDLLATSPGGATRSAH